MRLGFEIYTPKVQECKLFYVEHFGFSVRFEAEGFVVLQHPDSPGADLLFCVPDSPFVNPVFRPAFRGGAILQIEVDDVEAKHERLIRSHALEEVVSLTDEPANGYHFTIRDPGGLLVDVVQF